MASFPAEGTREQYVELAARTPKLLLLEPVAPGPYAHSLQKRGPGLHHIGAITPSIQALVPELCALGLLLHPISIQTLKQGVAWLCRPGIPFLIELTEGQTDGEAEAFELGLPTGVHFPDFVAPLFSNMRIYAASSECLELKSSKGTVQLLHAQ